MSFAKIKAFISLTRPFFLLGGVLFYQLGVVMAVAQGAHFNLEHYLVGQALVISIQLMVQYSNEYYDREVDAAGENRTWFSGGSGALGQGMIGPGTARTAAWACGAISLALLVWAALQSTWVGLVGGLALVAGWAYSAPPAKLAGRGWGELCASLVVAFLTPLTGLALQTESKSLPPLFFAASLPLVLIHIAMLLAFEFPDLENDLAFGKRTLVVRLGPRRAVWLHASLLALAFGLYGYFVVSGLAGRAGRFVLLALPLAVWQVSWAGMIGGWMDKGHRRDGGQVRGLPLLVTGAVGLVGITAILWLVGLIVGG